VRRVSLLEHDRRLGGAISKITLINVAQLVEALPFTPEGRRFDTWNF
jgi:hypothetical protein